MPSPISRRIELEVFEFCLDFDKINPQFSNELEAIFVQNRGDCPVELLFRYKNTATISLETETKITPNETFTLAIETLLGSTNALELR